MMNGADEVSPRLWAVAVKFVDDIIQKATSKLQKDHCLGKEKISPAGLAGMTSQYPDKDLDQWKDEPDQKSLSSSLGKEEMSPTGLAGVTSQHPDKDHDQWKGEPDQKSLSPSLGKDTMSPIGLAGVTSQCPDKDLDGRLTYLHQLNAARRAPQCYGSLFMQRKRRRMQHPQPSKQTHIKTRHSLPAAMGLAEEEKVSAVETLTEEQPATKKGKRFGWLKYCSKKKQTEDNPKSEPDQKSLSLTHGKEEISPAGLAGVTSQRPDKAGRGNKTSASVNAERKVPQHIWSGDRDLCMLKKHRRVHPQPSEESPIQSSRSLPAAAFISTEENKSGIRTTVLNEETLVLQSLETSPDNIQDEENRSAALWGETVEQEGEGRDQEVGQQTVEDPKGVESPCERDQELKVSAVQPVKEQQLAGEKGRGLDGLQDFTRRNREKDEEA